MKDLVLNLKGIYFDQIKAGDKREEYRLLNDYWRKRLEGREYARIVLCRGYPKGDDKERRIVRKWKGWEVKAIQHPHFGQDLVRVFAIDVSEVME